MLYKKIFLAVAVLLLALAGFWYYRSASARNLMKGIVGNPAQTLLSSDGRTNLVLLGIGGDGHTGSDLTDSIIFVSLNLNTHQALLVPIPRDIWIDSLKAKVNTAYHYGQERREGGGRDLVKSAVAELTGVSVHYAVVLDFIGFEKAIDAVGGIDVTVERAFDDYKYPIPGQETAEPESERYEHLRFEAGRIHMDGQTALKFARSRHAEGEEGTDFARSARQAKIILAFREKALSTKTLLSSDTLKNLVESISSSVDTDIVEQEYGGFLKLFLALDQSRDLATLSLEDHLVNPKNTAPYGGQWVLVPANSLESLQDYVKAHLPN